jgi:hypothetical protein
MYPVLPIFAIRHQFQSSYACAVLFSLKALMFGVMVEIVYQALQERDEKASNRQDHKVAEDASSEFAVTACHDRVPQISLQTLVLPLVSLPPATLPLILLACPTHAQLFLAICSQFLMQAMLS